VSLFTPSIPIRLSAAGGNDSLSFSDGIGLFIVRNLRVYVGGSVPGEACTLYLNGVEFGNYDAAVTPGATIDYNENCYVPCNSGDIFELVVPLGMFARVFVCGDWWAVGENQSAAS
jgi:hypothetical protein